MGDDLEDDEATQLDVVHTEALQQQNNLEKRQSIAAVKVSRSAHRG